MNKAWKNINLEGQGLQSANLRIVQLLKKRKVAYGWLLLFPLGMHRAYLEDKRGAWAYRLIALLSLVFFILDYSIPAIVLFIVQMGVALYDIRWIEDRAASLNKQLRMRVLMKQGAAVPRDFKGRYADDDLESYIKTKESERGGHTPVQSSENEPPSSSSRIPSFSEQEAMLRELAKAKRKKD